MNDQMTLVKPSSKKVIIGTEKTAQVVPGRRPELKYLEFGYINGTNGRLRAQVFSGERGMARPTGWHYHTCEMQFIYQLEGWIELEFHGRGLMRFNAGDTALLPGGLVHQEVRNSDGFRLLEISLPADMGTVNCDPPSEKTKFPAIKLATATPETSTFAPGRRKLFKYRELGVTEATGGRMRAQVTSTDNGLTEPTGWHFHTCEIQFVYMLKGWIDLEFEDGRAVRLEPGDSALIPGGAKHQETLTSPSFELLEVSLPAEMGTVACDPPAVATH